MEWNSEPMQTFYYDDHGRMKLTTLALNLHPARRFDKKGKPIFFLERYWHYLGLEESIADEFPVYGINDLESCVNDEKYLFEQQRLLPADVLFDGHRYFWRFEKVEDGTIEFIEKWFAPVEGDFEECAVGQKEQITIGDNNERENHNI
jgi:hypothetical protein